MVGITPIVPPEGAENNDTNMNDVDSGPQGEINDTNMVDGVEALPETAEPTEVKKEFPPDPPLSEQRGYFRWEIENFDKIEDKKMYSPHFASGPHNWNVMLFPRGNNNSGDLSMYLNVIASDKYPVGAYKYVHFAFGVVNHAHPEKTAYRDLKHEFKGAETDWGLTTNQWHIKDLLDPDQGYLDSNGSLIVEYFVQVLDCSASSSETIDTMSFPRVRTTGNSYWSYDSKKETGHVGICNQGVTCYMNSLLQTLFFTGPLRRAVYRIPTEEESAEKEVKTKEGMQIVIALQQLFYKLQNSETAPSTKQLTKAFGWNSYETFVQHDVQELSRVLLDNIDEKMKGTPLEGCINNLFKGKILHSIHCLDVQYESTREETFLDLSLVVKGCENIFKSFDNYTEVEVLEGDNKYRAEGFEELQRAEKGCSFISFPPVLHLHLKRFDFDFERLSNYKVNDRYEFPKRLNLNQYLGDRADMSKSYEYELHGVLVHSGDVHGGHYYAYLRPTSDDTWYKFDDDKVTVSTEEEAIDANYGGEEGFEYELADSKYDTIRKKVTSAYYLVYYRVDVEHEYAMPMSVIDIPESLQEKFHAEAEEEEEARQAQLESHKYRNVKVLTNQDLLKHKSFDLCDWTQISPLKVARSTTLADFKLLLADIYNISPHRMRIWHFITRSNKTIRPDKPYSEDDEKVKTLGDIDCQSKVVRMYLELADKDQIEFEEKKMDIEIQGSEMNIVEGEEDGDAKKRWPEHPSSFPAKPKSMYFMYVKEYNEQTADLHYIGTIYAESREKIGSIKPVVNRLRGVQEDAPVSIFEEITKRWVIKHNQLEKDMVAAELTSGDILIVQRGDANTSEEAEELRKQFAKENGLDADESKMDEDELEDYKVKLYEMLPVHLKYPTPVEYYQYLTSKVLLEFKRLDKLSEDGVKIEMADTDSYRQVVTALGKAIGEKSDYLRLYGQNLFRKEPKEEPFKSSLAPTLGNMRVAGYNEPRADCLYYEVLDVPLKEIECLRKMSMPWYGLNTNFVKTIDVTVHTDGKVKELLDALRPLAPLEEGGSGNIRIMDNWPSFSTAPFYPEDSPLEKVTDNYIRAEEISQEEADMGPTDQLIFVKHIMPDKYMARPFGNLFLLPIKRGETVASVRSRIEKKLGVKNEDIKEWKFKICKYSQLGEVLAEDFEIGSHEFGEHQFLGLEHADNTSISHHTSYTGYHRKEQAIKIYN